MPAPPDDARSQLAEVVSVSPCARDGVLFTVRPVSPIARLRGGRFFMLRPEAGGAPAIPRPLSLYLQGNGELVFLIKVIGPGTQALAGCRPGDSVRLIGPLGNGWPALDGNGPPLVLLAGGIGSAPFPALVRDLLEGRDGTPLNAGDLTLIYGAASDDFLYDFERFEQLGIRVLAATDDGSRGFAGNVVQCLEAEWEAGGIPREVRLLACGPDPMLRAVERLVRAQGLPCWLSLETLMGCGVGICNGCPVPTREEGSMGEWPNAKCCVEGPVFPAEAIRL